MENPVIYILVTANLIAFIQMAIDKRLAIKQKSRSPTVLVAAQSAFQRLETQRRK
jgi:uncharacterized membrane protein YsdA (DUF1294 family)